MAKTDKTTEAATTEATTPLTVADLRLGQSVHVKVAPGMQVMNNECGALFAADTPTPQTVTVTLLRRLADGDLVLIG